ncbi:hypothetical protein ACFM35_01030 [Microbacterium sp. P01]
MQLAYSSIKLLDATHSMKGTAMTMHQVVTPERMIDATQVANLIVRSLA